MGKKIRISIPGAPSFLADNRFGICLLDVYMLNYYGVPVFFQVCDLKEESVYLVELASKRLPDGSYALCKGMPASRKPLVISRDNAFTKSNYEVKPVGICGEIALPIEVGFGSPLHMKARESCDWPVFGTAYAFKVEDPANSRWDVSAPDAWCKGKDNMA